ncbi:MAG: hypothetical protein ACKO47_04755 [Alphaproteobacteria bacterium]
MTQDNSGNSDNLGQKKGNGESNGQGNPKIAGLADRVINLAERKPELAERAMGLAEKFAEAQANGPQAQTNGPQAQEQGSNPKKPLKKGISMQSKVMMGVGALMLMLVLGPIIFPAIAGMGAMGTAIMAGAGAGLLASGINKAINEKNSPQPTSARSNNRIVPVGNSVGSQGFDLSDFRQAGQQQGSQAGQGQQSAGAGQEQAGQGGMEKAVQDVRKSGVVDGLADNHKLISEVDNQRKILMDKLALPENLKTMVEKNSTDNPSFTTGFENHLKESFFANMGGKDKGRGEQGMGKNFLEEIKKDEENESKTAFNTFKDNMLDLLKKDNAHHKVPQAHEALVAEKTALEIASQQIEGLKAGNEVSKGQLSAKVKVGVDAKQTADKDRLGNLQTANEKISSAKQSFESKKSVATPAPATAPAPAAPARGVV